MHDKIQDELFKQMNITAGFLNEMFKPYGFCLLVFPFGGKKDDRINYISNASRNDMLIALKEFISANETGQPDVSKELQ